MTPTPTNTVRGSGPGSALDVTVVVPVRNRPVLLRRALESLAAQDHPSFEIIVVDDGSDEPVHSVVAASGVQRARILEEPGRGAGWARNSGAAAAASEWLTFLDSDDEADSNWLSTMLELASASRADLVFCGARRVRNDGRYGEQPLVPHAQTGGPAQLFLAGTFMLRTPLFRAVGGYDAALPAAQHTNLGLRLLARPDVSSAAIDTMLLTFHISDSGSIRSDHSAVERGAATMIAKHGASLGASTLASYHAIAGVNMIKSGGDLAAARTHLRKAATTNPRRPIHWLRWVGAWSPWVARRIWANRHVDT